MCEEKIKKTEIQEDDINNFIQSFSTSSVTQAVFQSDFNVLPLIFVASPIPEHVFNHLLAAPELTREQSAIFRIKGEKIHIF